MPEVVLFQLAHVRARHVQVELIQPLLLGRVVIEAPSAHDALVFARITLLRRGIHRVCLHEDVVVEAVVAMEDGHEARNLRAMADMVRRIAPARAAADAGERAQHEVMHQRHALRRESQGHFRHHDVVVNQRRAVSDLHKNVLTFHTADCPCTVRRALVVVQQILRDARALRLPVAPDAHGAVVDVVAANHHINRRVQLDAGDFRAAKLLHVVDVVDVVVLNHGIDRAHTPDDARLLAVVDVAAADDVAADVFLQPTVILPAANRVALHLRRAFEVLFREVVVVFRVVVFAQRNTAALAVRNFAILDNPALRPVRANHAILKRSWRRPCRRSLLDFEAMHRDVPAARFLREEAAAADVNFHLLAVGVLRVEVGIQHGFVAVLLAEPLEGRPLRIPRRLVDFARNALLQRFRLVEHLVVQIHRTRVAHRRRKVPVAENLRRVRIIRTECAVLHAHRPHRALIGRPPLDALCAANHRAQRLDGAIENGRIFRTAAFRIDIFAVHTGKHQHFVTGLGNLGGFADATEGSPEAAVTIMQHGLIDIVNHRVLLLHIWNFFRSGLSCYDYTKLLPICPYDFGHSPLPFRAIVETRCNLCYTV